MLSTRPGTKWKLLPTSAAAAGHEFIHLDKEGENPPARLVDFWPFARPKAFLNGESPCPVHGFSVLVSLNF